MMKKKAIARTTIVLALIVVILAAALIYYATIPPPAPPPPPPGPATITGKVTDAKTGAPVAGATVTLDGLKYITGPDGTYSFSVKVGKYTVTVSMTGYETKTASVDASEEKTYTVNVSIPPPPPPEKLIRITWTEGPEFDVVEARIDEFTAATGIKVEFVKVPRERIVERTMLEMLAPTGLMDGIVIYVAEAPTLWATGQLVNLKQYLPKETLDQFYPEQLKWTTFDDELIFLPGFWNGALLLMYREDLFTDPAVQAAFEAEYGYPLPVPSLTETIPVEKLPDVAEFFAKHPEVDPKGLLKYGLHLQGTAAEMGAGIYCTWPGVAGAFGGVILDEKGKVVINSPENVKALKYLRDMFERGCLQPTFFEDGTFEAELSVMEGTVAMAVQWSYMIPMLPDAKAPYGIAPNPFPQLPDSLGVAILKTSPKKDYVAEFVKWLASKEIVHALTLATPKAASRKDEAADLKAAGIEWVEPLEESYARLVSPIRDPRVVEMWEVVGRPLAEALSPAVTPPEKFDPEGVLDSIAAGLEEVMKY